MLESPSVESSHSTMSVVLFAVGNEFTIKSKLENAKQPLIMSSILTWMVCGFEVFWIGLVMALLLLAASA